MGFVLLEDRKKDPLGDQCLSPFPDPVKSKIQIPVGYYLTIHKMLWITRWKKAGIPLRWAQSKKVVT